ncbi:MAG TPA: hypothetical protein VEB60_01590, partial [Candidatus Paceibacterota bacterium]|nr:hypothetical protein [Candidatus Paceibacterota bacterium]
MTLPEILVRLPWGTILWNLGAIALTYPVIAAAQFLWITIRYWLAKTLIERFSTGSTDDDKRHTWDHLSKELGYRFLNWGEWLFWCWFVGVPIRCFMVFDWQTASYLSGAVAMTIPIIAGLAYIDLFYTHPPQSQDKLVHIFQKTKAVYSGVEGWHPNDPRYRISYDPRFRPWEILPNLKPEDPGPLPPPLSRPRHEGESEEDYRARRIQQIGDWASNTFLYDKYKDVKP